MKYYITGFYGTRCRYISQFLRRVINQNNNLFTTKEEPGKICCILDDRVVDRSWNTHKQGAGHIYKYACYPKHFDTRIIMILVFWKTVGVEKVPLGKTVPFYRRNSHLYKRRDVIYIKVSYVYIRVCISRESTEGRRHILNAAALSLGMNVGGGRKHP